MSIKQNSTKFSSVMAKFINRYYFCITNFHIRVITNRLKVYSLVIFARFSKPKALTRSVLRTINCLSVWTFTTFLVQPRFYEVTPTRNMFKKFPTINTWRLKYITVNFGWSILDNTLPLKTSIGLDFFYQAVMLTVICKLVNLSKSSVRSTS